MDIEFDEEKRQQTLEHRGLDFNDAALVFERRTINHTDDRGAYGEIRIQTIGLLNGRIVMVVWTQRDQARRIISMRKCNAREQYKYRELLD